MIREKRRKQRIIKRIIKTIVIVGSIVLVSFLVIYFGFGLKKISLEGTDLYTAEEIEEFCVTEADCDNTIVFLFRKTFMDHVEIPFIEDVSYRMLSPGEVMISVTEKNMTGCLDTVGAFESGDAVDISESGDASDFSESGDAPFESGDADVPLASGDVVANSAGDISAQAVGRYVYFDEGGIVTEISDRKISGPVTVIGNLGSTPVIGEKLNLSRSTAMDYLKDVIYYIKKEGMSADLIGVTDRAHILLKFSDITVELGLDTRTAAKIERLAYILPELIGKKGKIDLTEWSKDSDDIIFKET